MPATVPLSTPVTSVTSARALAESIALAPADAPVGAAVDRIAIFLNRLPYPTLRDRTEGILDVLHQLATQRSARLTEWLGRSAMDADTAYYWYELHELVCLGPAA